MIIKQFFVCPSNIYSFFGMCVGGSSVDVHLTTILLGTE